LRYPHSLQADSGYMPVGAIIQLVQMFISFMPEILKLVQDLKDGRYDGDGGANQLVKESKDLVQKMEQEHKKAA